MAPNVASNGAVANGNGVHSNGKAAPQSNGNGTAARPAVAPKSTHEDRWAGVERPYSQVRPVASTNGCFPFESRLKEQDAVCSSITPAVCRTKHWVKLPGMHSACCNSAKQKLCRSGPPDIFQGLDAAPGVRYLNN